MDSDLTAIFDDLGLDPAAVEACVAPALDRDGKVRGLARDEPAVVRFGRRTLTVKLKPIAELYDGENRVGGDPTESDDYLRFFATIERTAALYCEGAERSVTDEEFLRLYKQLKAAPDGVDRNPLFSYLQAGARLAMSLLVISKPEFRILIGRLVRSARTFRMSKRSCNDYDHALRPFVEP